MIGFSKWLKLSETVILNEADKLDEIIGELQNIEADKRLGSGGKVDFQVISKLAYDYLTTHDNIKNLVTNMITNDPKKFKEYTQKYQQLLQLLTNKITQLNYTEDDNVGWQSYTRGGKRKGVKDDNMTTKRYVSINPQEIWTAYQKLPVLASALNKVKLKPEADVLDFKIPRTYTAAIQYKDSIVIHYYDKEASPQIDLAVQEFLNAAGIKEMDRSKFNRTNFGKDVAGESDSQIVADRFAKYIELHKDQIPQFLKMPNLKQQLEELIKNLSYNSSHRAGVKV